MQPIRALPTPADTARSAGREVLADALCESRNRTLSLLDAYVDAKGRALHVPYSEQLNPPLWEAGHVGWFQDYWIARNRERVRGVDCDPDHARPNGRLLQADSLYNSSLVAHATRWQLPLPGIVATRGYLAAGLAETLALLSATPETDDDLYFFRLVLFHEAMHTEAAIYMAQALGIPLPASALAPRQVRTAAPAIALPAQTWTLGYAGSGFGFDNELPAHRVAVAAFEIDANVVNWARYLPFLDATGAPPRYIRKREDIWEQHLFGQWQTLALDAAATHLTWEEANAWCRWAGRRLPTEAEWEIAAVTQPDFQWGEVWEWTASRFEPFAGFVAHPYRDYSAPWFGDRYVLRGASRATSPRMAHPRYRNFFEPQRNDIHSGFRSCAL